MPPEKPLGFQPMRSVTGSHRIEAAKWVGLDTVPVFIVAVTPKMYGSLQNEGGFRASSNEVTDGDSLAGWLAACSKKQAVKLLSQETR